MYHSATSVSLCYRAQPPLNGRGHNLRGHNLRPIAAQPPNLNRRPFEAQTPAQPPPNRRPTAPAANSRPDQADAYDSRSTIKVMHWPPPTHIDSSPNVLSESSRPFRSVVMMRAPVMPKGW